MIGNQTLGLPGSRSRGRLLLCNIGRLGDTILSNSILDSAFRTYDRVDYLCGKHNAELVQSDRRMNRVIMLRNSIGGFAAVAKAALRRYDGFIGLKDCYSATNLILAGLFRSRIGGTPVFKGTRIPVHEIADMLANGDNPAAIVKAYPQLNRDQVRLAAMYALAYPRRGRPRTKTGWQLRQPKASEAIAFDAVGRE